MFSRPQWPGAWNGTRCRGTPDEGFFLAFRCRLRGGSQEVKKIKDHILQSTYLIFNIQMEEKDRMIFLNILTLSLDLKYLSW